MRYISIVSALNMHNWPTRMQGILKIKAMT